MKNVANGSYDVANGKIDVASRVNNRVSQASLLVFVEA